MATNRKPSDDVILNKADCDLEFIITEGGLVGRSNQGQSFIYCWSGARGSVGITGGKYCFGCKIMSAPLAELEDTPAGMQHICNLGISRRDDSLGNLGETDTSFGFDGTGTLWNEGVANTYSREFEIRDTIVCAVDLEGIPASIGFLKNGIWLGHVSFFYAGVDSLNVLNSDARELKWESALFPHVVLKNFSVRMLFSINDGLKPIAGYKPWNCSIDDGNSIGGPSFPKRIDRTVLVMVGLPGSGKSAWAESWMKENPQKRFVLLGARQSYDKLKVPRLIHDQTSDEVITRFKQRATSVFDDLLKIASKADGHFIIDQPHVTKPDRQHVLELFIRQRVIAVVMVLVGKEVPAVNAMIAHFDLPRTKAMGASDDIFDEVWYPNQTAEVERYIEMLKLTPGPPTLLGGFS